MTTSIPRGGSSLHWSKITFDLLVKAIARTAVTMNPPMSRTYRATLRRSRPR